MTEEEKKKRQKELDDEILLALLIALSVPAEFEQAQGEIEKYPEETRQQAEKLAKGKDFDAIRKEYARALDEKIADDAKTPEGEKKEPLKLDLGKFGKNLKAAV